MRTFKEITEYELDAKIDETLYFYLISDYIQSDSEDKESALTHMCDTFKDRREVTKRIKETILQNVKANTSYDEFEDILYIVIENELF